MLYGFALLRIKPFKEIHERGTIHFTMPPVQSSASYPVRRECATWKWGSAKVPAGLTNLRVSRANSFWPVGIGGENRGQTGLTANFRQTAPKTHVSLVSPWGGDGGWRNEANLE